MPKNRLRIQKIKCIEDLVQTDLFRLPECRDILLPTMLKHIHDMMESQDDRIPCIKVLSNIMDALFSPQKKVCHLSCFMRKLTMWFLNRSDTNWSVLTQRMVRRLKVGESREIVLSV